ncbi:MAG: hypothetical protein QG602_1383 [Verrucomicrobiota bacterium]|nr:hypothetical protein [Verrucomicrobiota bacterium]
MNNNSPARHLIKLTASMMLLVFTLTGCVSARYQKVDKSPIPPVPLNLTATQPPFEATLQSVVVYHGPGSWKRDAFWDEYVVSLVNRGETPLTIETASLIDFQGDPSTPGDNPWLLEKQSLTLQKEINRAAKAVLVQIGGGYLAVGAAGSVMFFSGVACGTAGSVISAGLLPVYAGGAIYENVSSRHKIEKEFQLRRLVLPQTIAPGQTLQGSLFFRISPGPQRLMLHGRAGDKPSDVTIDLTPLRSLHLKSTQPSIND